MNKLTRGLAIAFCLLAAAACTAPDNDEMDDDAQALEEHVWSGQVRSMDKARQVDGEIQDASEARRREIERQSR